MSPRALFVVALLTISSPALAGEWPVVYGDDFHHVIELTPAYPLMLGSGKHGNEFVGFGGVGFNWELRWGRVFSGGFGLSYEHLWLRNDLKSSSVDAKMHVALVTVPISVRLSELFAVHGRFAVGGNILKFRNTEGSSGNLDIAFGLGTHFYVASIGTDEMFTVSPSLTLHNLTTDIGEFVGLFFSVDVGVDL